MENTMQTAENLLTRIKGTSLFQKLLATAEAAEETARAATHGALAAEYATAKRAAADAIAELEARRPKAAADYAKAVAAVDAASGRLGAIDMAIERLKLSRISQGGRLEGRLASCADPRIDAALGRIELQLAAMRKDGYQVETSRVGIAQYETRTNDRAIACVTKAACDARQQLDELKLIDVADLDRRIEEIDATIPWDSIGAFDPPTAA
jgi:hypothetical protein